MDRRHIKLSLVILLISIASVYDQVTKRIVTRLGTDQAPKSEFGIVPVGGFGSQAYNGGVEYGPDPLCRRGSANALR
jgi:hypothetical protein